MLWLGKGLCKRSALKSLLLVLAGIAGAFGTGCIGGVIQPGTGQSQLLGPGELLQAVTTGSITTDACAAPGDPANDTVRQMFDELNNYRVEKGLQPLQYSTTLAAAAQFHAEDMRDRNYFSHYSPEVRNVADRVRQFGYCIASVGENLAQGQQDPAAAQASWEQSPGHNAKHASS